MALEPGNLFNWDEIDIGDHQLDHSQNFFARKHMKHERLGDLVKLEQLNRELALAMLGDDFSTENKENNKLLEPQVKIETEDEQAVTPQTEEKQERSPQDKTDDIKPETASNPTVSGTQPKNLVSQWPSHVLQSMGAVSKAKPPRAYEYKDIYESRRQNALRNQQEHERQMRKFCPKPVPNFYAIHEHLEQRPAVHAITVAITPKVLQKSRETEEKRKKKLEEYNRAQQPQKFEPRSPRVIREPPFVPVRPATIIEQKPFRLRSDKRLQERKQYDATIRRALEEKKKQEEEERRRREAEEVKVCRQMATFKARPNPFK